MTPETFSAIDVPEQRRQFVLLPIRGLRSAAMLAVAEEARSYSQRASTRLEVDGAILTRVLAGPRVLHSLHEDGAKLAELTADEVAALAAMHPDVRAIPVVYYELAKLPRIEIEPLAQSSGAQVGVALRIQVTATGTGAAVVGAQVVALTDFAHRQGAQALTDAHGVATLSLGATVMMLDGLVIYGPAGYWGFGARQIQATDNMVITLEPINLAQRDFKGQMYGVASPTAGLGVRVGVIDTGVDTAHQDLTVSGGAAFVTREQDAGGFGPARINGEHGTHVAGILAARGRAPTGVAGLAPAMTLMSYRVFANDGTGAANYDIVRAIDQAVSDGCDLINLSLQLSTPDAAVQAAIQSALDQGSVCVVAAGNDHRQPVAYPARWPESVAVSAVGKRGTFPAQSSEVLDVMAPFSTSDPNLFPGAFSNCGPEIAATAPGVGIVSTLPGNAYGVMSGTSMACPALTGALATLLAQRPAILQMPRSAARSNQIKTLLQSSAHTLGLPLQFQGLGVIL